LPAPTFPSAVTWGTARLRRRGVDTRLSILEILGITTMTGSDFGLMVVRPIFVAAIICAYPNGISATLASHPHVLPGVALLSLPLMLLFLSSKRAG
jgi:hypothetical protein